MASPRGIGLDGLHRCLTTGEEIPRGKNTGKEVVGRFGRAEHPLASVATALSRADEMAPSCVAQAPWQGHRASWQPGPARATVGSTAMSVIATSRSGRRYARRDHHHRE
jgi:hypothetical protein